MKLREGNVFSRVCLSTCSNLFTWWLPAPPSRPLGPVQTCSFKKLSEWPSTERPSQWWISDFPEEVAPTSEFDTKTYYLTRFLPKTAWKWKKLDREVVPGFANVDYFLWIFSVVEPHLRSTCIFYWLVVITLYPWLNNTSFAASVQICNAQTDYPVILKLLISIWLSCLMWNVFHFLSCYRLSSISRYGFTTLNLITLYTTFPLSPVSSHESFVFPVVHR